MNTTEKGNAFEQQVYKALKEELNAERLGLLPHSCEIFRKRSYFSKDRGSNIVADISIEVTLPNANRWSFLWVWECKDHKRALSVGEVEEFDSKLRQIAGDNIKGALAVSGGLQSAAFDYACSKGIGVVRILPKQQIQWILYQEEGLLITERALNSTDFSNAITNPDYISTGEDFYAVADGYMYSDWCSLVCQTIEAAV